jgi:FMN phosphatase YigB (HAD superfamily)
MFKLKQLYKTQDVNHLKIPSNCQLVIFDLDDTLHTKKTTQINIDIIDILQLLKNNGVKIALVSLNSIAEFYLDRYNIYSFFDCIERKKYDQTKRYQKYSKTFMYKRVVEKFNIPYENVLVFDDNWYHCLEARWLGIKSITIKSNYLFDWNHFKRGIRLFDKRFLKNISLN